MPERLNFTLVADGPSDRALILILEWALGQRLGATLIEGEYADLGELLPQPPKKLSCRIAKSVELYPCELLFVHRDAERESFDRRQREIQDAIDDFSPLRELPAFRRLEEDIQQMLKNMEPRCQR